MRPLSEMLADLSVHAKSVEDKAAAAQTETHDQINAKIQQTKDDARQRSLAAEARRDQAGDDISSRWGKLQADWRKQVAGIREDIQDRREEHDAKVAQRRADRAEENAVNAIDFAESAIDAAGEAVLEAIDARVEAAEAAAMAPVKTGA